MDVCERFICQCVAYVFHMCLCKVSLNYFLNSPYSLLCRCNTQRFKGVSIKPLVKSASLSNGALPWIKVDYDTIRKVERFALAEYI